MQTKHRVIWGVLIATVCISLGVWCWTPKVVPSSALTPIIDDAMPTAPPREANSQSNTRRTESASNTARLSYCSPDHQSDSAAAENTDELITQEFMAKHPELGLRTSDVALINDVVTEIGVMAAETTIDIDTKTQRVHRTGRYHQQNIEQVAAMAESDAEAALIYGSYLMHKGMLGSDGMIDLALLQTGERMLQSAAPDHFQAIRRIYIHYYFASLRAWKKGDRSARWQQAEIARAAYRQWLQQHGSAAVAIMMENDTWFRTVHAPDGSAMPAAEDNAAAAVMTRLTALEQTLPAPTLSAEQIEQREQLLWLHRRGSLDQLLELIAQDCAAQ
ncbi:MAG: hypothetical protein ACOY3E_04305 [Pseudomonadota bacterium]